MAEDANAVPPGRPAFFAQQMASGLFAAHNALFLLDPERLHASIAGDMKEARLLESFTARGRGMQLCVDGILVPAFGVEAGYYTVLVRSTEMEGALMPLTHIVYSAGFVLGTATGQLLVANADYLSGEPVSAEHRAAQKPVQVSPGWYRVTVVAGIRDTEEGGDEGWICAFLLDAQETQPHFAADLTTTLSFFAG
jgi:hypothetical protein